METDHSKDSNSEEQKDEKPRISGEPVDYYPAAAFVLVVVRQEETGKLLAVRETRKRGWWLPAGHVEANESFEDAARRETLEEGGIRITLKGILRIEWQPKPSHARLRVIFYAVPEDSTPPKAEADSESMEAKWVTLEELQQMARKFPPLRGFELLQWGKYLRDGGTVFPLSLITKENQPAPDPRTHLQ